MNLTWRERQVANLLLEGCDNAEIATRLGLAQRTVKAYVGRLFRVYGIRSGVKRVKLVVALYREQRQEEGETKC